jgi:hypothetical protein
MTGNSEGRPMLVALYRSKPNAHTAPGGYWFLRLTNPLGGTCREVTLTPAKAAELEAMGVPRLEDGGGL